MTYRHCLLTRSPWNIVTWVSERLAVVGRVLTLDGSHMAVGMRSREEGWTVRSVYGAAAAEELAYTLNAQERLT